MSAMVPQITSLTIVYSRCRSRKHQSSVLLDCVRGIHRWPMNSPHKGPETRKMFTFDDVIMRKAMLTDTRIALWHRYTSDVIPLFTKSSLVPPGMFSCHHCYTKRTFLNASRAVFTPNAYKYFNGSLHNTYRAISIYMLIPCLGLFL